MKTDLNLQILMVVFIFFYLDWKYPFWGKFGPENQNYWFKLKFSISLTRIHRIQYDVHFFSFKLEILYGKAWSKKTELSV